MQITSKSICKLLWSYARLNIAPKKLMAALALDIHKRLSEYSLEVAPPIYLGPLPLLAGLCLWVDMHVSLYARPCARVRVRAERTRRGKRTKFSRLVYGRDKTVC